MLTALFLELPDVCLEAGVAISLALELILELRNRRPAPPIGFRRVCALYDVSVHYSADQLVKVP